MNRRKFNALLGGALTAVAVPRVGKAQPAGKAIRVGFMLTTSPVAEMLGPDPAHPAVRAFVHAMRDLGYVEGRSFILDRRSAEGKYERFGEILDELLRLKPNAIITVNILQTLAAKKLTTSIPIVFVIAGRRGPCRGRNRAEPRATGRKYYRLFGRCRAGDLRQTP